MEKKVTQKMMTDGKIRIIKATIASELINLSAKHGYLETINYNYQDQKVYAIGNTGSPYTKHLNAIIDTLVSIRIAKG